MSKQILMVAGPNGAGKTTLAFELLEKNLACYEFVNADEIARGLAPKHPESVALTASKLMITRLKELLEAGKNFAFETTAAGTNYVKHLKAAKAKNYEINLTFLWLSKPEEAIKRVAQRVKQGGHHVAEDLIIRRYYLGMKNLVKHYLPLMDRALIIDGSSEQPVKRLIVKKKKESIEILDQVIWNKIMEIVNE